MNGGLSDCLKYEFIEITPVELLPLLLPLRLLPFAAAAAGCWVQGAGCRVLGAGFWVGYI
jgi:hypothetical protein